MYTRILLSTIIAAAMPLLARAVNASPGAFAATQSDGTTLTVTLHGDETFSYSVASDGTLLYQEGTDFFVALVMPDGTLASSGTLAHEPSLRSAEETALVEGQDRQLFYNSFTPTATRGRLLTEPMPSDPMLLPSTGEPKVVVILAEFTDTTFSIADPKAAFNKWFNAEELFTEADTDMGRNYGSVARYYSDMSFGQFRPQFDVYGPYTMPHTLAHYGAGSSTAENMTGLFGDACDAADDDIDFSQYDANGDGRVDLVAVIAAGYAQSFSGNSTDCIWPKSGSFTINKTYDGKSLRRYTVSTELFRSPAATAQYGPRIAGVGVFCHEFAHCLGLPDMYAAIGTLARRCVNQYPEYWDLMDMGEFTNDSWQPTALTAWERERLGWMTIDTLTTAADVSLTPIDEGGKAWRIINDAAPTEYFIVENMQKRGWNEYLYGRGMIVFHVDYSDSYFGAYNMPNGTAGHPRMTIIPADGLSLPQYHLYETVAESSDSTERALNQALTERYNGTYITADLYIAEQAGDPFPGTSGVTELTDTSNPSAWTYTGGHMGKPITDIAMDETTGEITFKFLGGAPTGIDETPAADEQPEAIHSLGGVSHGAAPSRLSPGIYLVGGKKYVVTK